MGRATQVLGFSVPPELAKEYARLAKREKTTKSELFRRMVEEYRSRLDEQDLRRLQKRMARPGRRFTEKEVERIVFEDR